jgi:hypothetical protein
VTAEDAPSTATPIRVPAGKVPAACEINSLSSVMSCEPVTSAPSVLPLIIAYSDEIVTSCTPWRVIAAPVSARMCVLVVPPPTNVIGADGVPERVIVTGW